MSRIRPRVVARLKKALELAPDIAVLPSMLDDATGCTYEEMLELGLEKSDLKILESEGWAIRARLKSGRGNQVRWIFLRKDEQSGRQSE